jgi:hypothetical protein
MPLCLATGALVATLAVESFTLAWTHSIEKVRWEEDWHIENAALVLDEARIRGSGAGMEPPAGAVLRNGVWHYRPQLAPLPQLRLAHSPYTAAYELCGDGRCRGIVELLPGLPDTAVLRLHPCAPRRGRSAIVPP